MERRGWRPEVLLAAKGHADRCRPKGTRAARSAGAHPSSRALRQLYTGAWITSADMGKRMYHAGPAANKTQCRRTLRD